MDKQDFVNKEGTRFSNILYERFSEEYDVWVNHYNLQHVLDYIENLLQPNLDILECGAGTGLFTPTLYKHCKSIVCVDLFQSQIDLLRSKFKDHEQNERMSFFVEDINTFIPTSDKYDLIFFGFSLDNILNYDPYLKNDLKLLEGLLKKVDASLNQKGICIIVDSMPEQTIPEEKKQLYRNFRNQQMNILSKQNDFLTAEFNYMVEFPSHEAAVDNVSLIVGKIKAHALFKSTTFNLSCHVTSFRK